VPPLPVFNHFACLDLEYDIYAPTESKSKPMIKVALDNSPTPFRYLRKWECQLPKEYVLASVPGSESLMVKVEIQTTDTGEIKSTPALVDCGATGQFID